MKKAYRLEYLTIAWNSFEALVAIVAGGAAGSIALVAFGLDSVIEVFAAAVVLRELRNHDGSEEHKDAEKPFLRIIAVTFFLLAAYVAVRAITDLLSGSRPEDSPVGIVLTAVAFLFMLLLARAKHRTGHEIDCLPLIADSNETKLCSLLSLVTLIGLLLNEVAGLWWADPIAALAIAGLAIREGIESWSGEHPESH